MRRTGTLYGWSMRRIGRFLVVVCMLGTTTYVGNSSSLVSADHVPVDATSSTSTSSSTSSDSTSTTIGSTTDTSIPAPRSPGRNSYLTIDLPPVRDGGWMGCSFAQQVYCYEPVGVITPSGIETLVPAGANVIPITYCQNNDRSSDYCVFDGSDWIGVSIAANFNASDVQNTYHWKLRTGKFEPDIMMLGDTQKSVVAGNETTGWTLEIWARPTLKAWLSACYSAANCGENTVATTVRYGLEGYVRMLGVGDGIKWPSVATKQLRDALRGTWISTNGMTQSWVFSQDKFSVTAISPHFLPSVNGAAPEVGPGYVRVFLPTSYVTLDRGYTDIKFVTSDKVELTVSGAAATANVTIKENGLLIDTGVTHFSAPNPVVKVLKADEVRTQPVSSGTVAPALSVVRTQPVSSGTVAPALSVVRSISVIKRGKSVLLASVAKPKESQKPKWSASGACSVKGTQVVASKKKGTCKVTLRVLNSKKKYVVSLTKKFKVS